MTTVQTITQKSSLQPTRTNDSVNHVNYIFYATQDSPGNDLQSYPQHANDIMQLGILCNADHRCRGFTTNGVLKQEITDPSLFTPFTTDTTQGLFIKNVPKTENITFSRGADITGQRNMTYLVLFLLALVVAGLIYLFFKK